MQRAKIATQSLADDEEDLTNHEQPKENTLLLDLVASGCGLLFDLTRRQ